MKKSRLLEIIREEISAVLHEGEAEEKAAQMAAIKAADLEIKALQKKKAELMKTGVAESEELNEIPDFAGAGGRFDKQVAAKYGEEDTLEAATEKVTNRVLSDKGITKADVAKMDTQELKALLKDIRAFISQKKQSPEVAAALEKQKEFDDSGSNLQDNQTNKAILRVLGFGSKKGPKGPTKSKEEKPAKEKASKTEKSPKAKAEPKTSNPDEAPAGDAEMEKAARGRDDLTIQYRGVMDIYKKMKAEEGDKAALEYLKTKQNIVKAYKKAQEVNI
jgi:hypothetical protein